VGNHPHGKRLHHLIDVDFQRAAAPLILLFPSIPMLFMGEELATSAPFPFFADFEDAGLRRAVDRGRQEEYPHHDWQGTPLPSDPLAFLNSKLDDAVACPMTWNWYRRVLSLRRQGLQHGWLNAAHKRTTYDSVREVFWLIYETASERIMIASRLAPVGTASVKISLSSPGEILLDSRSGVAQNGQLKFEVELSKYHCCVWKEKR
jgi:1,4-alpha-glucan branching enzyme